MRLAVVRERIWPWFVSAFRHSFSHRFRSPQSAREEGGAEGRRERAESHARES